MIKMFVYAHAYARMDLRIHKSVYYAFAYIMQSCVQGQRESVSVELRCMIKHHYPFPYFPSVIIDSRPTPGQPAPVLTQ